MLLIREYRWKVKESRCRWLCCSTSFIISPEQTRAMKFINLFFTDPIFPKLLSISISYEFRV